MKVCDIVSKVDLVTDVIVITSDEVLKLFENKPYKCLYEGDGITFSDFNTQGYYKGIADAEVVELHCYKGKLMIIVK